MKNLQKNFSFYTQQNIMQMEENAILQALNSCSQKKEKQDIIMAVNQNALDRYTPVQIRISIENALKKVKCYFYYWV